MASLTSLQKRFDRAVKQDDFYGAEQACRMMHHRLMQSKDAGPEEIERARKMLHSASITLLQKHQIQAGAALGLLLLKHSEDYRISVSEESVAAIREIAESFDLPNDANESTVHELNREKLRFLRAAVSWSAREDCSGFKNGHAGLNSLAADAAVRASEFDLAQRLFVHSDNPEAFAAFLHEYTETHTLRSETGLVLTNAILKYLVSDNVQDAIVLRTSFARLKGWKSVEAAIGSESDQSVDPPVLGNFCELIIKLCQMESAAAPLFTKVISTYEPELKRDESIPSMITIVGTKYLGIQPAPPAGLGGMMNSMLRGLMST